MVLRDTYAIIFANDIFGWIVVVVGWGRMEGKYETTEILPNKFADYMLLRMRVYGSVMG